MVFTQALVSTGRANSLNKDGKFSKDREVPTCSEQVLTFNRRKTEIGRTEILKSLILLTSQEIRGKDKSADFFYHPSFYDTNAIDPKEEEMEAIQAVLSSS